MWFKPCHFTASLSHCTHHHNTDEDNVLSMEYPGFLIIHIHNRHSVRQGQRNPSMDQERQKPPGTISRNIHRSTGTATPNARAHLGENYGLQTTTKINQSPSGIICDKKSNKTLSQWTLSLSPIGLKFHYHLPFANIKPIVTGLNAGEAALNQAWRGVEARLGKGGGGGGACVCVCVCICICIYCMYVCIYIYIFVLCRPSVVSLVVCLEGFRVRLS